MKSQRIAKLYGIFLIFSVFFTSYTILINYDDENNLKHENYISPQDSDDGKKYDTISEPRQYCYVNRYQSSFNNQPNVYMPNLILADADMEFENIKALNYTYNLEPESTSFLESPSTTDPMYFYQKFSVEMDQYINNVSIFIQDIGNALIFNEDNSWEVAIVNCSNDNDGAPNATIQLPLMKPHPLVYAAHWEVFDFLNSEIGPIFLNTSKTNYTVENGIKKYWFAFRIRIPPEDSASGGGPKLLYFNLDEEGQSNNNAGDTFAILSDIKRDNYTLNEVNKFLNDPTKMNGSIIEGTLNSFKAMDSNRFIAQSDSNNLTIGVDFNIKNMTGENASPYLDLIDLAKDFPEIWNRDHLYYIFSIDIYIAINISNPSIITSASLMVKNCSSPSGDWVNFSRQINFDITPENELLTVYKIRDPEEKIDFLKFLNTTDKNNLTFKFVYESEGTQFNVSINQFTIEFCELFNYIGIVPYDPLVKDKILPNNIEVFNATTTPYGTQSLDTLEINDDKYFRVQGLTNNITIEFNFSIAPDLNSSLWKSLDVYDWIALYPNPLIPWIDISFSSNQSITEPANLTHAILEIYKGERTYDFLDDDDNNKTWIPLGSQREFAFASETQVYKIYPLSIIWMILQLTNSSTQNSIKLRLRYMWNETHHPLNGKLNATFDEFTLKIYIQNVISSDITSRIGFGLRNSNLKPSDIKMKNLGKAISDNGNNKGTWIEEIADGTQTEGFYNFDITSIWNSITFEIIGSYSVYKLLPKIKFIEDLDSEYHTGENVFSVEVTDYYDNPIESFEVLFEVLDQDGKVEYDISAFINEDGIASASLNFEKIGEKYSIRVSFEEEGVYYSEKITSEEFRVVDDLVIFMDTLQVYLPYLIVAIAAICTLAILRHRKSSKLRELWTEDALLLDDLLRISYIMIIHKDIGVAIYNKQLGSEDLDSDLISGFITAISQFKKELKKDVDIKKKSKGFVMDYYDFKILIVDGEYIRVALILSGTPSEKVKENQERFVKAFENKYRDALNPFMGDLKPFKETFRLVERIFNISLNSPLILARHWKVIKLGRLEKDLAEIAELIQKEKRFFFISSLLNLGLAGRRESRDQIISTLLSLKEKGIIIPLEMETQ